MEGPWNNQEGNGVPWQNQEGDEVTSSPLQVDYTVSLRLTDWPQEKRCSAVYYPDGEAQRVYNTLQTYPMANDNIALPICHGGPFVAYELCSRLTVDLLREEGFPADKTFNTVRRMVDAMFDLHEAGIGGLPPSIYLFVRSDDKTRHSRLHYASTTYKEAGSMEWENVVKNDYAYMEVFVRQLISSTQLKKSEELLKHFVDALHNHRTKRFEDQLGSRYLVTQHPLLMTCEEVVKFLKFVGWSYCEPTPVKGSIKVALESIPLPPRDWRDMVKSTSSASAYWYKKCLKGRHLDVEYEGSHYLEYCRDFLVHPEDYGLHDGLSVEEVILDFEEFYPSYLGLLWAALGKVDVYVDLLEINHF